MHRTIEQRSPLRFISGMVLALSACQGKGPVTTEQSMEGKTTKVAAPVAQPEPVELAPGPMPAAWVKRRTEEAQARLQQTEAGKLLSKAIDAHGGLSTWLSKGTIEFAFDYAPIGKPEQRRYTFQQMDLWRAYGRHEELGEGSDASFGFDGKQAWIAPGPEAFPSTARFWTTTPYYFLGMPFVLGDPGVHLTQLPDAPLAGKAHRIVKATFEAGIGDSPDDYYILYLDPESGELAALRYIVAYPGFFDKGKHSPEKLMVYSHYKTIDGIKLAHQLDTFAWDPQQGQGERVTAISVSRIALGKTYPKDFAAPKPTATIEADLKPTP